MTLFPQIIRTVQAHDMIAEGDVVVLAVSGGADSTALLRLLTSLCGSELPRAEFHAAHLHHGLRGAEADADAEFAARQARSLGLPFHVDRADVPALARQWRLGVETAARRARYEFLGRVAEQVGARSIATGHHADDNVETVLMRLLRGRAAGAPSDGPGALVDLAEDALMNGIDEDPRLYYALRGIPAVRPLSPGSPIRIIRPLLDCRARDLRAYLRELGVPWREDATNAVPYTLRNRVRLEVIPALEGRLGWDVSEWVIDAMAGYHQAVETVRSMADQALEHGRARMADAESRAPVAWLLTLAAPVQAEVVRRMIARLAAPGDRLTARQLQRVLDLLGAPPTRMQQTRGRRDAGTQANGDAETPRNESSLVHSVHFVHSVPAETRANDGGPGPPHRPAEADLPGDLSARREYGQLVVRAALPAPCPPPVAVPLAKGKLDLSGFGGSLRIELRPGGLDDLAAFRKPRNRNKAIFDAGALRGVLAVRAWRPGDRMRPLGAPGVRKLQDIFTDLKVPRPERHRSPLLTLDNAPIWLIGCRVSETAKVTGETKCVAILTFRRP